MTLLAIDPGKRIGFALFTGKGEDIERGVIQFDDWFKNDYSTGLYLYGTDIGNDVEMTFKEYLIDQIVVEGFRHDPLVKQGGSEHWASQVIGDLRRVGAVTQTSVSVQYSTILPVAMMHAGYEPPKTRTGNKKHLPDEDSAWLHGRYWLTVSGILT